MQRLGLVIHRGWARVLIDRANNNVEMRGGSRVGQGVALEESGADLIRQMEFDQAQRRFL